MTATLTYRCDASRKATPPVVLDSDDPDFDLPVGWVQVTVTRAIPNPDYAEAVASAESELATLDQQLQVQGIDDPATREEALAPRRRDLEGAYPTQYIVVQEDRHFHPDEAPAKLAAIGVKGDA